MEQQEVLAGGEGQKQVVSEVIGTQETPSAEAVGEEIKRSWRELRTLVRQIYAKIKVDNSPEEGFTNFSISFEKTYNLVYKLCKHDAETLFRKLETEAQNWLESLRESLVSQLSSLSVTSAETAQKFLVLFQRKYEDLCKANEIFNGIFIYLHNCFLKQLGINFGDVNKGLFWEIVYLDPILQTNIPRLKAQLKKNDSTLQQYIGFEKKLKETRSRWKKLKKQLEQYDFEKAREARLREECQQLQQRWQKLEDQKGSSSEVNPDAMAEHVHSCPFCFHQHVSPATATTTTTTTTTPKEEGRKGKEGPAPLSDQQQMPSASGQAKGVVAQANGQRSVQAGHGHAVQAGGQPPSGHAPTCGHGSHPHHHHPHARPGACGSGSCNSFGNGWHCCVHSHFMYCDHFPESTREKLQEKLRSKLNTRAREKKTPQIQAPTLPVEDERSLDELLSFINDDSNNPKRSSKAAKRAKKKQKRRQKKRQEKLEAEKAEAQEQQEKDQPRKQGKEEDSQQGKQKEQPVQQQEKQSNLLEPPPSSTRTSSDGDEKQTQKQAGKMSLQEKLKAFTEFPQFWEEDDSDMDPMLKEQEDKEVEAFRLRLEASDMDRSTTAAARLQISDDSVFDAITEFCLKEITAKKAKTQKRNGNNKKSGGTTKKNNDIASSSNGAANPGGAKKKGSQQQGSSNAGGSTAKHPKTDEIQQLQSQPKRVSEQRNETSGGKTSKRNKASTAAEAKADPPSVSDSRITPSASRPSSTQQPSSQSKGPPPSSSDTNNVTLPIPDATTKNKTNSNKRSTTVGELSPTNGFVHLTT